MLAAWYVAMALPGLESTALMNLKREEIRAEAPAAADKKARVFPGYVFIWLDEERDCFVVNRTRGIIRLLPVHTREPLSLPNGFVEDLMARVSGGEFDEKSEQELLHRFLPGEVVVALTGPMRDKHGRFSHYKKGCGIILGSLLGRQIEYPVPLHQLKSIGASSAPESRSALNARAA